MLDLSVSQHLMWLGNRIGELITCRLVHSRVVVRKVYVAISVFQPEVNLEWPLYLSGIVPCSVVDRMAVGRWLLHSC